MLLARWYGLERWDLLAFDKKVDLLEKEDLL